MKILFFLLLICFSTTASAVGYYIGPGIGYSRFVNDQLKSYDAVSAGPRFGVTGGYNFGTVALESFYNSANTKTNDRTFNGNKYIFHAKMKSFGIVGKFFINFFHIRFGYALHHFDMSVTSYPDGGAVHDPAVLGEFGANGKNKYNGPLFGFGADFPIGMVAPYAVITSYQLGGTNADIMEIEFGLKINL